VCGVHLSGTHPRCTTRTLHHAWWLWIVPRRVPDCPTNTQPGRAGLCYTLSKTAFFQSGTSGTFVPLAECKVPLGFCRSAPTGDSAVTQYRLLKHQYRCQARFVEKGLQDHDLPRTRLHLESVCQRVVQDARQSIHMKHSTQINSESMLIDSSKQYGRHRLITFDPISTGRRCSFLTPSNNKYLTISRSTALRP